MAIGWYADCIGTTVLIQDSYQNHIKHTFSGGEIYDESAWT
jgi:hypothetical protein